MANLWVILDRDGVINFDSDEYIKSADEWRAMPGSLEAMARLYRAGYRLVVASNQSGIARGLFDHRTLAGIHRKMIDAAERHGARIEAIFYCPHLPASPAQPVCDCRKPLPGLLHRAMQCFQLQARNLVLVGDSQRDLEAARAAGIRPILVRSAGQADDPTVETHADLAAVADALLGKAR